MALTDYRQTYRPFEYPVAYDFYRNQQLVHWTKDEIKIAEDIQNWQNDLTETEKAVVGGILKGFTQMEVLVGDYWRNVPKWFPKPEIGMMCSTFSYFETIHQDSYALINESLGLDDFAAFLYEETTKHKLDYFIDIPEQSTLEQKAKSLAIFSAFAEGCMLFSSFAVLLSFQRENLLKGVSQIVSFSIRDENCFSEDTEILTNKGFIKFSELSLNDMVAQFDNHNITFVKPTNYIKNHVNTPLVRLKSSYINSLVTPNHDILVQESGKFKKIVAGEFKPNGKYKIPVTGNLVSSPVDPLTWFERFCIAIQADGTIRHWKNHLGKSLKRGKNGGYNISFNLTKQRKIDRLIEILDNLKYEYKISGKNEKVFYIKCPDFNYKNLNWVIDRSKDLNWCDDFIDEIICWDGSIRKDTGTYLYCSTDKTCIDIVQMIAIFSGYRTNIYTSDDLRKDTYKRYYRLALNGKNKKIISSVSLKKTYEDYNGFVYCVTVPSGNIITRLENNVFITGNCHSDGGCWLFNQLCSEFEHLREDVSTDIYAAAHTVYELEKQFIDNLFGDDSIRTLNPFDLKQFIKHRINTKLIQIGYNKIFEVDKDSIERMEWFNALSAGREFSDFFSSRVGEYTKVDYNSNDLF
jgi:ribonucleotide reductase beta subunit family protein with ferritin-like domain